MSSNQRARTAHGVRTALVGPRIVTSDQVLDQHAVLVEGGRVEAIVPRSAVPEDVRHTDLGDGYLSAGLVDIHVHGAGGRSFNEGSVEAFQTAGEALLAAGITTVLPTLASAPVPDLTTALEVLGSARSTGTGPTLPGIHLEGPYFAHAQRGAQDAHALRVPSDGSVVKLMEHADAIAMMSFAPELDGSVELTRTLVANDVVAAAGHSDGTADDLAACEAAGLSHVIHVFSGQSTTVRRGPWRVPGMLEASLASDTLTVEMIADGKHLPPLLMRLAHRGAGDRLCLVSDATAGAGLPDESTYRMGEVEYVVADGVGMTMERDAFGGSTTLLSQMLPIARAALDVTLPELFAMVTTVPARAAALEDVGRIAPGCRADLTLFDEFLAPRAVAMAGAWQEIMTSSP